MILVRRFFSAKLGRAGYILSIRFTGELVVWLRLERAEQQRETENLLLLPNFLFLQNYLVLGYSTHACFGPRWASMRSLACLELALCLL